MNCNSRREPVRERCLGLEQGWSRAGRPTAPEQPWQLPNPSTSTGAERPPSNKPCWGSSHQGLHIPVLKWSHLLSAPTAIVFS